VHVDDEAALLQRGSSPLSPPRPAVRYDPSEQTLSRFPAAVVRLTLCLAMLASCAGAILIGQYFVVQKYLNPSDDNLYVYYNSLYELRPDNMRENDRVVLDAYARLGASNNLVLRYEMRRDYRYNYFVLRKSLTHYIDQFSLASGKILDTMPMLLGQAATRAYVAAGVAALLMLLAAMAWCAEPRLYFVTALACAALLFFDGELLSDLIALVTGQPLTVGHPSIVRDPTIFKNLMLHIFNPNYGFKAFTLLPPIGLLMLGPFLLRWTGKLRSAYVFAIAIAAFHQSMSTFMLAWLIALDLVQRPGIFKDVRLIALISAAAAIALWRESIWYVIAVGHYALLLVVLVMIGALAFWLWRRGRLDGILGRVQTAWSSRPALFRPEPTLESRVRGDMAVSAILWAVSLTYPFILNKLTDELLFNYFWAHAHGRILSAVRPAFFVGIMLLLVFAYERRRGEIPLAKKTLVGVGAIAIMLVPMLYKVKHGPDPVQRIASALVAIDRRVAPLTKVEGPDEEIVYYAIAKQTATGQPVLRTVFPEGSSK
jgi:hypothetical protein